MTRRVRQARRPSAALDALVAANYASLHAIAEREIRASRFARSISPSSLVAESMMRLV